MKKMIASLVCILLVSCVEDMDHNSIETAVVDPDLEGKTVLTFQELFDLHGNEIGKDTIVSGYVVSSDKESNFYKEVYIQNTLGVSNLGTNNPRMGLRIRLGLRATNTKYAPGRKVAINLEGLKRTVSDNLITLGAPSGTFIKEILEFDVDKHLLKFNEVGVVVPKEVAISELKEQDLNTFIKVSNVHFKTSEFGKSLAGLPTDNFDGKRTLEFCEMFRKDSLIVETSNFANFASEKVPENQLNVTGIYAINFDNEPVIILNSYDSLEDIGVYSSCEIQTPKILITEVADPDAGAGKVIRYVELYNPMEVDFEMKGWRLNKFVNANKEPSSGGLDLSDITIPAKSTFVIAHNEFDFKEFFGFAPDMSSTYVTGNGDDSYQLEDNKGVVVDTYGVPGLDGTDEVWEYENGRAIRKIATSSPTVDFSENEWEIQKDIPTVSPIVPLTIYTPGIR